MVFSAAGTTKETELIEAALSGDGDAFERLVKPDLPRLSSFILRMLADPDDRDDILQETLLQAHQKLGTFRGRSKFSTWLFSIASRKCIDALRDRARWPREAQLVGQARAHQSEAFMGQMTAAASLPDFAYSVNEHMAFCFTCVGRMLEPEDAAALLLREVFELSNREGAKALGLSQSVFRHHLSDARRSMQGAYDGLCALVGKGGACYQCEELREFCPGPSRGRPPEPLSAPSGVPPSGESTWSERVRRVREADLDGSAEAIHRLMFRFLSSLHDGPARSLTGSPS